MFDLKRTLFALLLLTAPITGAGLTVGPGYGAAVWPQDFVGKDTPDGFVGVFGMAGTPAGDLYASDVIEGGIYKFGPSGGVADDSTRIGIVEGGPSGLAFHNGRLYCARLQAGDVVELDPNTAAVIRTVVPYLNCPAGLDFDPLTGDLFVSLHCAGTIIRVHSPESANPSSEEYAVPGGAPDQLAFNPNGMFYVGSDDGIQIVAATSRPDAGATRRF